MVEPGIYIDGAHNPDGITCFLEAAEVFHRDKEVTLLFSAISDKDYKAMVRELASLHPEQVITTRIPDARGVSEEELAQLFLQVYRRARMRWPARCAETGSFFASDPCILPGNC